MAKEAADNSAEIPQVASYQFVHEICLWPVDCSADGKVNRGVTGGRINRLKIIPTWSKELAADLVIQGKLRIEMQFALKADGAGGG